MPEAPSWQFKQVKRVPDRDATAEKTILTGRLFTGRRGGTIEDGFVRFENGRITESGPPNQLAANGGWFARFMRSADSVESADLRA